MFFLVDKIEQATYYTDGLHHPAGHDAVMSLHVFRTCMRSALFTVHAKKAYGEFWDQQTQKRIGRRSWTKEMRIFHDQKVKEAPKPPFTFRLTVVGWIFVLLVVATFGMIGYNAMKPPLPKSALSVAMEAKPAVGDIYFGHFETYKEVGTVAGAKVGFGWFKVEAVEGDTYYLVQSAEMSKTSQPKEGMNRTDFGKERMELHLVEQTSYTIRFKSPDKKTEVYISDKK
ncbi:hypothetical protein [Sphingobacterium bambusae]|uniref:DUF4178 domain-containing protein n=1 Tax=Sphingobacterium bambusae TaxID=662858 RepID=A0ABW6BF71_9SPHI|nr:hypothetical protein [Sphingobacterium bambusae]WPL48759.1 hypothetical protein SCB77_22675 [Sphingobacterium bambusae]